MLESVDHHFVVNQTNLHEEMIEAYQLILHLVQVLNTIQNAVDYNHNDLCN